MPPPTDVLIIGGSHAGLAATQTLYRHGHTVTILDSSHHRPQPPLRLVPGFEASSGATLRETSRKELSQFAGDLVKFEDDVSVTTVKRTKYEGLDIFEVEDTAGRTYTGRILLLATGAVDEMPDVPGYTKCWPQRIFHCLFTFGQELRGAHTAALWARDGMSSPLHAAMLAGDALKIADRAVILTDGRPELEGGVRAVMEKMGGGAWADKVSFDARRVGGLRLVGEGEGQGKQGSGEEGQGQKQEQKQKIEVQMDGEWVCFDFLVHQPSKRQALPGVLQELGVELDERGDIKMVNPFGGTTAEGVYAAGDAASLFKIVPAAQFSGAAAGAGVARALGPGVVRERFGIGKEGVGKTNGVEKANGIVNGDGHVNGAVNGHA